MSTPHTNRTFRVTNSAIKLFETIKPYHTHVLDVVERYQFEEPIVATIADAIQLELRIQPRPDCDGEGWGSYYDNIFCGYDAAKCCEPFTCTGGFGGAWGNDHLFVRQTIEWSDTEQNTIAVSGNHTADRHLPIVSYPSANVVRVAGDPTVADLFNGDGVTIPSHIVFELSPIRDVAIRSVDIATNSLELDSRLPADFNGIVMLRDVYGTRTPITIIGVVTTSQGYVVATIDPSYEVTATDLQNIVTIRQTSLNSGTYTLWNRVTSPEGVTPVIYEPGDNATVVIPGTVDIRIGAEFTSPVEFGRGSILLRTALTYPRVVEILDEAYTINATVYDAENDVTILTLAQPLPVDIDDASDLSMRGTDGTGYDGFPLCSATTDTLLAPMLRESLDITYIETELPPAHRLAQSSTRFSANYASTLVRHSSILIDRITNTSMLRFGAPAHKTQITITPSPLALTLLSAGPSQDVEAGTLVTLTAAFDGPTTGHTLEWEQTSGDPVTLTIIDETTVAYTSELPAPGSRQFTFYVDRGTPNEQSHIVQVRQVVHAVQPAVGMEITVAHGDMIPLVEQTLTGVEMVAERGEITTVSATEPAGLEMVAERGEITTVSTTEPEGLEMVADTGLPTPTTE